ncbi:uncharacterized protein K452DRAFT_344492 [Aplosporella prunicola CBS 121167]|uniref:Uncharacterized protein n=1 Tax=Aplosporella prunicola CBS 121167 TaxID=1176127 RepID=A0A6A6BPI1_9PEZI|nr:uncharacterized protein K452DRAFT_344492 [Aplosporella prunicola CBS 121167]KAF2144461.1 hypothetical protein K452DRAFT_344492 [Aplosporella prunicola CBS 121167]
MQDGVENLCNEHGWKVWPDDNVTSQSYLDVNQEKYPKLQWSNLDHQLRIKELVHDLVIARRNYYQQNEKQRLRKRERTFNLPIENSGVPCTALNLLQPDGEGRPSLPPGAANENNCAAPVAPMYNTLHYDPIRHRKVPPATSTNGLKRKADGPHEDGSRRAQINTAGKPEKVRLRFNLYGESHVSTLAECNAIKELFDEVDRECDEYGVVIPSRLKFYVRDDSNPKVFAQIVRRGRNLDFEAVYEAIMSQGNLEDVIVDAIPPANF